MALAQNGTAMELDCGSIMLSRCRVRHQLTSPKVAGFVGRGFGRRLSLASKVADAGGDNANWKQSLGPSFSAAAVATSTGTSIQDLPEGFCLDVFMYLEASDLCKLDAACRLARELNRSHMGPWRALGLEEFSGIELDKDGAFGSLPLPPTCRSPASSFDWKVRYLHFRRHLPTFRAPFSGRQIVHVQSPDAVAYCRCMVSSAEASKGTGVCVEIEVHANPDNLSLSLVDFEGGGHSSVTFSPDTGAVIRERKVREMPRKVEGCYVQPLGADPRKSKGFTGSVAVYIRHGHVAFFRRCAPRSDANAEDVSLPRWESTGFVTDLSWARGRCVTPCIAFRDGGAYSVRIACISSTPPMLVGKAASKYNERDWTPLDWDATELDDNQ